MWNRYPINATYQFVHGLVSGHTEFFFLGSRILVVIRTLGIFCLPAVWVNDNQFCRSFLSISYSKCQSWGLTARIIFNYAFLFINFLSVYPQSFCSSVFRELKKYQKDSSNWCGECQREKKERQRQSITATKLVVKIWYEKEKEKKSVFLCLARLLHLIFFLFRNCSREMENPLLEMFFVMVFYLFCQYSSRAVHHVTFACEVVNLQKSHPYLFH